MTKCQIIHDDVQKWLLKFTSSSPSITNCTITHCDVPTVQCGMLYTYGQKYVDIKKNESTMLTASTLLGRLFFTELWNLD